MSYPVYRDAHGRYAVAVDHVPDEAVALEADLAAAQATAARLNEALASLPDDDGIPHAARAAPAVAASTAA